MRHSELAGPAEYASPEWPQDPAGAEPPAVLRPRFQCQSFAARFLAPQLAPPALAHSRRRESSYRALRAAAESDQWSAPPDRRLRTSPASSVPRSKSRTVAA